MHCLVDYNAATVMSAEAGEQARGAAPGRLARVSARRALSFDGWHAERDLTEQNLRRHSLEVWTCTDGELGFQLGLETMMRNWKNY